jgi:hypothetical protein
VSALPRRIAVKDDGSIVDVETRWSPRKVLCQSPEGDIKHYAVKYRRDKESTAAAISEIVGHGILQILGVTTLEPAVIEATEALAQSYRATGDITYNIFVGEHFGTLLRLDFNPVELDAPGSLLFEQIAHAEDIVRLYVADSWLMNLDRGVFGNVLLELTNAGKWRIIAADQSDCFLGARSLADGSYISRSKTHGSAALLPGLTEQALLTLGTKVLDAAIRRVRIGVPRLQGVLNNVPRAWWNDAGIEASDILNVLTNRADHIHGIVRYDHWKGLSDAAQGGTILL